MKKGERTNQVDDLNFTVSVISDPLIGNKNYQRRFNQRTKPLEPAASDRTMAIPNGTMATRSQLNAGSSMNLAKTLQVQDQIIEQLRADQTALREALEAERAALRECRLTSDRELKALQREKLQINKVNKQQEVKIEELEKELAYTKEVLAFEQKNLKSLEKEHVTTVKELKLKMSKDFEKINKQEMLIDQLKSEVEDLKEALNSERNATNLLIREHSAEVKMLREEVKSKSTEAYRELKERATREREEYREMQEEAERTYRVLEKDFRDTLAAKDEELRRVKAEAKLIQKELEDQLRASLKEPSTIHPAAPLGSNDFIEMAKFRRLKNEVAILKEQNRKLLNELQNDASPTNPRPKPAVPKKPVKLMSENDVNRTTHVKDMIRKLQEKEPFIGKAKPNFVKVGGKPGKTPTAPDKEEMGAQASNQTLEDLKAIDEDIEKLRKQIEERDKIISALREAAEAKDKKLDNLMVEYSKLQPNGKLDFDTSPEPNRATSSSPSSPPLCNGELCWTDNFVNKNYHEPVYAQLLNDHSALQKVYNELRAKLESKGGDFGLSKEGTGTPKTDVTSKLEGGENAINLIMAEQIRVLKKREAQLIWEAEELREQNDLMEFRILELEECRKEFLDKEMVNEGKHRAEKIVWRERDIEEISDSGVMSLPTSEDLTSDSELGEAVRNYSPLGAITNLGLSTLDNSHSDSGGINDLKLKKSLKSSECLQESGIFVDTESSDCAITAGTHSKACQTEFGLDKTLLDIIDSSCDLFLSKNPGYLEDPKSDDLSTEISKLSVIQKRIQQKTTSPTPRSSHTVLSCPHSNSVLFYEERLSQLEEKLKIYESSGDTKDILLAKRLQKEVDLSHRVKELTDKVTSLETINKKLEEEKCEFEEAENDTRFQCQRLEIRLQELIEKNTDLELELERHKVIMSEERRREKLKGSLEGLMSKYEQRNFELEEKEAEARQRLSMIEAAMPAIVAYNMFKMVQNPELANVIPVTENKQAAKDLKISKEDSPVIQKLNEAFTDKKKPKKEYKAVKEEKEKEREKETDREKALKTKIQQLEAKAEKDRETLEEMTNTLKKYRVAQKSEQEFESLRPDDIDLFEELKQMVANEIQLRAQIERLEKKEQAYMQSLEKADEIWAGMEADYKQRLQEAEVTKNELLKRVSQLEAIQAKLEKALAEQSVTSSHSAKAKDDIYAKIQQLIAENEKLKKEFNKTLNEKFEEHRKFLETENSSLKKELKKREADFAVEENKYQLLRKELELTKEEMKREKAVGEKLRRDLEEKSLSVISIESSLQGQISELTQELNQKSKELSSLEVTVAELREEVETLENKVEELVETVQTTVKNQEEVSWIVKSSRETPQLSLPLTGPVGCCVSANEQKAEECFQEKVDNNPKLPSADQILIKMDKEPPTVHFILSTTPFIVFAAPSFRRQEIKFLFSYAEFAREFCFKRVLQSYETIILEIQERPDPSKEEIFQLSLKNTELQQILEKMEEESKLKDKELEELQKLALEIRQEQENLELLYGMMKENQKKVKEELEVEEKVDLKVYNFDADFLAEQSAELPSRSSSIDILQTIVVKSSDRMSTSLSCLQIALDNLQNKYRSKTFTIKPLLDELKQKGDNRDFEDFTQQLALEFSSDALSQEKNFEGHPKELVLTMENNQFELPTTGLTTSEFHQPKLSTPRPLSKTTSATCPLFISSSPKGYSHSNTEVDQNFFFTAPITTIRKVCDDGIFLEWDVAHQPSNVTGFEIRVNGVLTHRVRSSTRNKALLRPLNLKDKISIQLYAVSEIGRSMRSSYVTYPDEFFLQ